MWKYNGTIQIAAKMEEEKEGKRGWKENWFYAEVSLQS